MKSRHRRRGILAAIISASFVIASCSNGGEYRENSDDGKVQLRMITWTSDPGHLQLFNSMAKEFMDNRSDVEDISFESVTTEDLDTILTTQLSSDNPPDLSWLPVERSAQFIDAGALVDLKPTLEEAPGYDYEDFAPSLMERWASDDSIFGVPFSTSPFVLFYNKDLYAQADVANPAELIAADDWDWSGFREISQEVSDSTSLPGYTLNDFDYRDWTRLLPILNPYGAAPWDDSGTTCTADSPEMLEAMTLFHNMIYEDGSVPPPGAQSNFWGGDAASISAFLSSNALLEDADFDWGIAPMPAGPRGNVPALAQAAMVAYSNGDNADVAADFIAFMTSPDNAKRLANFFPPARESLLDAETLSGASTHLTPELVEPVVSPILEGGQIFPVATNGGPVEDALNSSLDELVYGEDSNIAEGLQTVCENIGPLLAQE